MCCASWTAVQAGARIQDFYRGLRGRVGGRLQGHLGGDGGGGLMHGTLGEGDGDADYSCCCIINSGVI